MSAKTSLFCTKTCKKFLLIFSEMQLRSGEQAVTIDLYSKAAKTPRRKGRAGIENQPAQ